MDSERLYEEYYRDVFRFVLSLAKNPEDAEEVTQETFVKALTAIRSFDGSKDIRAWLFTIARNTYISKCRKQKHIADKEADENQMDDSSVRFMQALEDEETAFLIHKFLHTMEEPYKEVFSLRVFGELDFKKIGSLFGKSDSWARVTFYRAKNQIREYMEGLNNE